jgi:hypothetical protein
MNTRFPTSLKINMTPRPAPLGRYRLGVKAPAGAAVVASRLALYAALVKAGAMPPGGSPGSDAAAALAKRILLAWADRGFRDANGHFLELAAFTRDGHGRPDSGLGITLGRGIICSVHAQDLLESLGALNADEVRRLKAFHGAIFERRRQSENVLYAGVGFPYSDCSRYTNLATKARLGMLATARLLNGESKVNAVLFGGNHAIPVLAPWTHLFDHLIYGRSDGQLPAVSTTMSRIARAAWAIIMTTRHCAPHQAR